MTELKIKTSIDNTTYTAEQLSFFEYQRNLHVLHELKRLGVPLQIDGQTLSDDDLNWLAPAKLARLSLDTRMQMGPEKILKTFAKVKEDTDHRWHHFLKDYKPEDSHVSKTIITVSGVSLPETLKFAGGAKGERSALALNPEHFIVKGAITEGPQYGMETFGMFGEPTYITGSADQSIPQGLPIKRDPTFPKSIFGETHLADDNTNIHVGALHEFKPTAGGFVVQSTFFCPGTVPEMMASGHQIHFAIELTNAMKMAYKAQTEN